jgi:hypothetical protein
VRSRRKREGERKGGAVTVFAILRVD